MANEKIELSLPFCGFYDSILSSELDLVEEMEAEYIATESEDYAPLELEPSEVAEAFYWTCNYRQAFEDVARAYVETAAGALSELIGEPVSLEFARLVSPREYNFRADELCVYVTPELWARMVREVKSEHMGKVAKARHTSRDGFASFYSPAWETWGEPEGYDDVQRDTLFLSWLELHADKLAEMVRDHWATGRERETAADNFANYCESEIIGDSTGVFYSAFSDCVDWDAFDKRIRETAANNAGDETTND